MLRSNPLMTHFFSLTYFSNHIPVSSATSQTITSSNHSPCYASARKITGLNALSSCLTRIPGRLRCLGTFLIQLVLASRLLVLGTLFQSDWRLFRRRYSVVGI